MAGHDIIVIGASAGGIEPLLHLVSALPPDLPAAIFVVLHIPAEVHSRLPSILRRAGPFPAFHPSDKQPIVPGQIYVAPPDHHLLLERGFVRVGRRAKENRVRPAVDPLFRSAARAYGPRVVGVICSGALDDGTAGLLAIKRQSGVTIVQDPQEALFSGMPQSAVTQVSVDHILPIAAIPPVLVQLAQTSVDETNNPAVPEALEIEVRVAEGDPAMGQDSVKELGPASSYSCPECGGMLRELHDNGLLRFRCITDHAYSSNSVLAEKAVLHDDALWAAFNTAEETMSLTRRMATQARQQGQELLARGFEKRCERAAQRAARLHEMLHEEAGLAE